MENNKPVYIYTKEELYDFWFNFGGKLIYNSRYGDIPDVLITQILSDTENHLKILVNFLSEFVKVKEDIYSIHDVVFWLNMYLVCEHDTWLFNQNDDNNRQWYFNTPFNPFEIYLKNKMQINPYETFETKYPPI
jgi:hypothetical protein